MPVLRYCSEDFFYTKLQKVIHVQNATDLTIFKYYNYFMVSKRG